MPEFPEREQKVLEAIVTDYIKSGEPVGSRTISKKYGLKVSSATIRNVMADLEEMGYLHQPHTSAGRVPTEKGLRFYLDSIMESKRLRKQERDLIREAYREARSDVGDMLRETSRILSRFCQQVGVVLWPRWNTTRFRHIELIRLRSHQVLAILVSTSGLVYHTVLDWEEDVSQDDLVKFSRYLNELLHDLPLGEVRQRILDEMQTEKVLFDELFAGALEMSQRVFQADLEDDEVYIEGQTHLLRSREFADVERMRRILHAFEDKSRIVRLLDQALGRSNTVHTILGPELESQELHEISLISSPYRRGDTTLGVVGVIGPLRMDYSRIIPVVEFTAKILSELLVDYEEE